MDTSIVSTLEISDDLVKLPTEFQTAFLEPRHTDIVFSSNSTVTAATVAGNDIASTNPAITTATTTSNRAAAVVAKNTINNQSTATIASWRPKERMKTVSVALVLCLNVGIDPPDILKTQPCAKLECWFDPYSASPQKAIEYIGNLLEKQYVVWQAKARYKKSLDPTRDELKKLCALLRRSAKDDRVLFHYNGHGVPKPTRAGEIWAFNNNYTQYMPLPIKELHSWIDGPSVYVFDCSCAGAIIDAFLAEAREYKRKYSQQQEQQQQEKLIRNSINPSRTTNGLNLIHDLVNNNNANTNNNNTNCEDRRLFVDDNQEASNYGNEASQAAPNHRNHDLNNQHLSRTQHQNNNNNNNHCHYADKKTQPINQNSPINPSETDSLNQERKYIDYEGTIHLAACANNQILPMNPTLPADLFTSCLTTPIKIALRWFLQQNYSNETFAKIDLDSLDQIPGQFADRRTMLGELNWIFTAVTDTIAWNTLPLNQFQRLFRQDLLVASLFRNFLLAERIMRTYNCTPVSYPKLPPTHHHSMWKAWDMVVDLCLSQLPNVINEKASFKPSSFFAEQLTAFEVWLDLNHHTNRHPEHLPIVLQVLLSPVHRLRALDLLCRFLNLGSWAVFSALSVGIFPYILKLLQSSARDIKPYLVTIFAKILANDISVRADLVREGYHRYFLSILADNTYDARHRSLAAFVMTCIVRDYPAGQEAAFQGSLIANCLEQILDPDPSLRRWATICLGYSWNNYEDARWCGVRDSAHEKLYALLQDPDPEVRAATVLALGTFINSSSERTDHANTIDQSIGMKLVYASLYDSSVLVRYELVVALQYLILAFEFQFIQLESSTLDSERRREDDSASGTPPSLTKSHMQNMNGFLSPSSMQQSNSASRQTTSKVSTSYTRSYEMTASNNQTVSSILRVNSLNAIPLNFNFCSKIVSNVYQVIWKAMYTLAADPHHKIANAAQMIIDEIRSRVLSSAASNESLKESKSNSSFSEPSSPNATFSISDLPITSHQNDTTKFSPTAHNSIGSSNASSTVITPTATTNKIDQQVKEWTKLRNLTHQNVCLKELLLIDPSRFNDNVTTVKSQHPANLILFHPLDPLMFVSSREEFSVFQIDLNGNQGSHSGSNHLNTHLFSSYNQHNHNNSHSSLHNSSSSNGLHSSMSANILSTTTYSSSSAHGKQAGNCRLLGTQRNNLTSSFFCKSKSGRITSMQLINPHDQTLVLTGTNEGSVRIWRPYTNDGEFSFQQQLVSAFFLMPELQPQRKSLGMVLLWQQHKTCIYATSDQNDIRVIKVWDAQSESKIQEIPTCAEYGATCLSSDGEHCIAAGFIDGSIRIYDTRLRKTDCRTFTYRQHTEQIVNLHLFKPNEKHINLVSGDVSGDVRFWDSRAPSSVKRVDVGQKMVAMDVHQHADLFACGLGTQEVKIFTLDGTSKAESVIKNSDYFFTSQKLNKLASLSFHPLKASMAIGLNDGTVSTYSARSIAMPH